jgi:hypothetical protein
MNEKLKIKIKEKELNITIYPDGKCAPIADEVFMLAGLKPLIPEMERFYDMLGNVETESLIKWVCYRIDGNYEQTRKKIEKYLLIDAGCRMCFGKIEQIRVKEFRMLRDFISMLDDEHIFSYRELAEMLNKEGFEVKIN